MELEQGQITLSNKIHCTTNAKSHFGGVSRTGGVRYLGTTKSSDFVYFDGSEYFVTFNE